MGKLPYENYIFDLYGTLVDIHTEEDRPEAWAALARFYSYYGADYAPRELQQAFRRMTAERTAGREAPPAGKPRSLPGDRDRGGLSGPVPAERRGRRPTSRCPPWTSPPWAAC